MNIKQLEKIVIDAFCTLDSTIFNDIDDSSTCNDCDKEFFIENMECLLDYYKSTGLEKLTSKKSECKYCYPSAKAYSFFDARTSDFVVRDIVHQDKGGAYIIQECGNKIIPDDENGMPF